MQRGWIAVAFAIAGCGVAAAQQAVPQHPLMLFFDWDKPDIRSDDQAVLDEAVVTWRASADAHVMLSGHTDRSGSASVNLAASRKRAAMVRDELIKRGIPAGAIRLAAYGEQRPLVPTEDGVREVQNRRVEIQIVP